jgi:hypothetical protein
VEQKIVMKESRRRNKTDIGLCRHETNEKKKET